jgi:hypothetical protein
VHGYVFGDDSRPFAGLLGHRPWRGVSVLSVGAIEGIAEATTSFVKIFSGRLSDGLGRRKVLVVVGYALSAAAKLLFPLAETASSILTARTTDRKRPSLHLQGRICMIIAIVT